MRRWFSQRSSGVAVFLSMACLPIWSTMAFSPLAVADVVRLLHAGVGFQVIQRQIEATDSHFVLSVDDLVSLRQAGAGDELLSFMQTSPPAVPFPPPPVRRPAHSSTGSVRVIHLQDASGGEAIVLTNLAGDGPTLKSVRRTSLRGLISASDGSSQGNETGALHREFGPPVEIRETGPVSLPSAIDITIHRDTTGGEDVAETRLADLEDRLDELETGEERPAVGSQGFPQHPINDHRDYPIVSYPYGFPLLAPFAFEPQEFRVIPTGTFLSFTGAFAAGVDPFHAARPCTPGQACSVSQRLLQR